jgi:hypothetical protein
MPEKIIQHLERKLSAVKTNLRSLREEETTSGDPTGYVTD